MPLPFIIPIGAALGLKKLTEGEPGAPKQRASQFSQFPTKQAPENPETEQKENAQTPKTETNLIPIFIALTAAGALIAVYYATK